MATTGKLVLQDSEGIWLAPSLAANRTGLSRRELARRAALGELPSRDDDRGRPAWYREDNIAKLVRTLAFENHGKADRPKPKRKLSDAALEAKHTRAWKAEAKTRRYGGGGAIEAHLERVMIAETFEAAKAKKPNED